MTTVDRLPNEILRLIFEHPDLHYVDVLSAGRVCQRWSIISAPVLESRKKAADLARPGEVYYEHPVPAAEQEFRGDVPRVLASIRWGKGVRLQNVSLDTADTRALVSAMGNKITNVELAWNSGDKDVILDVEALTQYDGKGKCKVISLRHTSLTRDQARAWARRMGWPKPKRTQYYAFVNGKRTGERKITNFEFKNIHSDRYRREQRERGELVSDQSSSEDEADEWMEKHVELPKYEDEIDVGHFLKMTMRKIERESRLRRIAIDEIEMDMAEMELLEMAGPVPELWI